MRTEKLQYSILIYILSIIGLPLCCFAGFGIIPAAIAFFIAHSELKKYYKNPTLYTNQDSIYTGKIIALIVLIINALYFIFIIYRIYTIGWNVLIEQSQELIKQY